MHRNTNGRKFVRIACAGHAVFAVTMIALGILGLIRGNFAPIWQPVPNDVPAREVLIYLCALISIASGIGLLWQRTAATAARVLLAYFLLWLLVLRVPILFTAFTVNIWWASCQTAVMTAAAWVLYSWFAADWDRWHLGFATGDNGLRIARGALRLGFDPFRPGSFHLSPGDRRPGAWLATSACGLGVLHGLYLHRGGRGGAYRCLRTTGGNTLGAADRFVHAAGVGTGRGGGRQCLPVDRVRRLVGADDRRLGGGGFLPRHVLARVG
jgi:uncharacterized membrane protein